MATLAWPSRALTSAMSQPAAMSADACECRSPEAGLDAVRAEEAAAAMRTPARREERLRDVRRSAGDDEARETETSFDNLEQARVSATSRTKRKRRATAAPPSNNASTREGVILPNLVGLSPAERAAAIKTYLVGMGLSDDAAEEAGSALARPS